MDPKPTTRRRVGAPSGGASAAPRSSHIIDLRQADGKPAAKRPGVVNPARPAAPAGERTRGAAAKPGPTRAPKKPERQAPVPATTEAEAIDADDVLADPRVQRRFWPAFARFLVLLIILGLIVAGGVYLYITQYSG